MRKCIETFDYLIKAHAPIIWVTTHEEYAFLDDICTYAAENNYGVSAWCSTGDLEEYNIITKEAEKSKLDINGFYSNILDVQNDISAKRTIYIFKDAHTLIENNSIRRMIRNLKEYPVSNYCPIILLSPITSVPIELEKLVTTFVYELPDREEVTSIVNNMCDIIQKNIERNNNQNKFSIPNDHEKNAIINSLLGLTLNEINFVLSHSVVQHRTLNLEVISKNKINIIEKSGLLDYVIPKTSFNEIGGNDVFKQWIKDIEYTFDDAAIQFGCEPPQGYMALGVAGTGKTIIAEAIADRWGYPLFIFNVSKIFDKLVGQSEKKIEQALRIVKSCAPCILLFDEAEKIFSGYNGSESDGGTSSRVFSSILRFMAENKTVFIIMTSNDVSRLPPELTRSGRLDTTFYFGFPTPSERKEIFNIHFNKVKHPVSEEILGEAVKLTNKYTGAEIKNIVKQTIWQTYKNFKETGNKDITIDDVKYAISKVIPVSKTSKEKITALENYAKQRALFANGKDESAVEKSIDELLNLKI